MRQSIYLLMTAAALAGCTNVELPLVEESNKPVEITVSTGIQADGMVTRTPMEGDAFVAGNTAPAKVMTTGTTGKYSMADDTKKLFYDGTMLFKGAGAASFETTKQYYPTNGDPVYFCGLFPSAPLTAWTVETGAATASCTFDGKTDVMAAKEISGTKTETDKSLEFTHLLTKLIIRAQTAGGTDATTIQEKWGTIDKIELKSASHSKVTVDLVSGTAAPATAFTDGVAAGFYGASSPTTTTYAYTDVAFTSIDIPTFISATEATAIAYSLTAPFVYAVDATTLDLKFDITTTKGGKIEGVVAKLSKAGTETDTQGRYCIVTFTFKLSEIQAKASIKEWVEGGTADGEVK